MTETLRENSSFAPRQHAATFYDYENSKFCVDRFQARSLGQACSFAMKRAPKGCSAISIDGPENSIFFHLGFSREAVDSSPTGLRAGAPGR